MKIRILTPEKTLFDSTGDEMVLDTVEGRLGILDNHAPLLASLKRGTIKVRIGSEWQEIRSSKGLLEVQKSNVTILLEG